MFESMEVVGSSITLRTNHRAESQCIIDNAIKISRQQMPDICPDEKFHQISLDDWIDDSNIDNG